MGFARDRALTHSVNEYINKFRFGRNGIRPLKGIDRKSREASGC